MLSFGETDFEINIIECILLRPKRLRTDYVRIFNADVFPTSLQNTNQTTICTESLKTDVATK